MKLLTLREMEIDISNLNRDKIKHLIKYYANNPGEIPKNEKIKVNINLNDKEKVDYQTLKKHLKEKGWTISEFIEWALKQI